MAKFRVTFTAPVNFTNGEDFIDVEVDVEETEDPREEAQEKALDFLEGVTMRIPSIKSIRCISED